MSIPQDLIDAWLDAAITDSECQALGDWLARDPANAEEFTRQVTLHTSLRRASHTVESPAPVMLFTRRLPFSRPLVWSLVGCLLAAVLWLDLRKPSLPAGLNEALAVAFVSDDSTPHPAGESALRRLVPGSRLRFASGNMELQFTSGASVTLAGEVDFEVKSMSRAILHRGQLTASVGKSGRGFTIATPHADVVDLGTRFGVQVADNGDADVVVFEGLVDILYRESEGGALSAPQNLSVGEAVRITGYRAFKRIQWIQQGSLEPHWSTLVSPDESKLVASISDNAPLTGKTYYSLVLGGFGEDAPAFVDREYQWNSLPGMAFPEVLRGADYIRTRNGMKYAIDLQMKVALKQPVTAYVLFDERVPIPAWLKDAFTPTDMRLGLDENYFDKNVNQQLLLGSGPGESVDLSFRVWQRVIDAPGVITLGSAIEPDTLARLAEEGEPSLTTGRLSMYGVVFVPRPAVPAKTR